MGDIENMVSCEIRYELRYFACFEGMGEIIECFWLFLLLMIASENGKLPQKRGLNQQSLASIF